MGRGLGSLELKKDNPLGAADIIAAQRMALSSNPPSPADYSPASLDAKSLRFSSNASARPSVDSRGRPRGESRNRTWLDDSGSGSPVEKQREVLRVPQEEERKSMEAETIRPDSTEP